MLNPFRFILMLLVVLLLGAAAANAAPPSGSAAPEITAMAGNAPGAYDLTWSAALAGGAVAGGDYVVDAVVDQGGAGASSGGVYTLEAGYGGGLGPGRYALFLPQVPR